MRASTAPLPPGRPPPRAPPGPWRLEGAGLDPPHDVPRLVSVEVEGDRRQGSVLRPPREVDLREQRVARFEVAEERLVVRGERFREDAPPHRQKAVERVRMELHARLRVVPGGPRRDQERPGP